jgi:phosphopantothenoylcysteine decarboxylase/phosphopantothenate--cysteine ligase
MNILIGVTGGISAYKAADLIGALKHEGYSGIRVIMTERAKDFITPLTLATLSKSSVYDDAKEWAPHGRVDHIELAEWADTFVIAPATANTIAKMVHGIADNLLTSTYLAYNFPYSTGKRVVVCPAMNNRMYDSKVTQNNIRVLFNKDDHFIVPPVEGMLACGTLGIGKLAPTRTIIQVIKDLHK